MAGVGEQPGQAFAEECAVLGDHDAHANSATSEVPFPDGLERVSVPPAAATRSPSEVSPKAGSAPPTPSSRTSTTTRPLSWATLAESRVADACFSAFVNPSATTK